MRLNKLSEQMGMKVLLAINKAAMDAQAQDQAAAEQGGLPPPDQRFTLGLYFYSERADDAASAPTPPGEAP